MLGNKSGKGQWESETEVPSRFQAVAQGRPEAGPHSVVAEHDRMQARKLAGSAQPSPSLKQKEDTPVQQFTEVDPQGQPLADDQSATEEASVPPSALPSTEDVLEAMRDVIDPELGINIVDLGLVYGVEISPSGLVALEMTLTSAACPLTDLLEQQTYQVLSEMASEVQINWVWMPPWGPDRITEEGRDQLRALGFNV